MTTSGATPGGLPVFEFDLDPARLDFSGNGDFWPRVQSLVDDGGLSAHLDACLSGQSAPRVWVVLFDEGQAGLAAAAGFSMAAALCERDQSVLVLDGDDHQSLLTRLAGRHEAHGWIDMARYGASILSCGVDLPFAGRRGHLLGAGSFTPTDVTAEEVDGLLTRLRRQADDIIILAPLDPTGRLWNDAADIRLLCWDRTRIGRQEMDTLADALGGTAALVGLVAAGEAAAPAEPVAPPEELEAPEDSGPVSAADPAAEPEPAAEPAAEPEAEPAPEPAPDPVAANMAAILAAEAEAEDGPPDETFPSGATGGQRTSRIFWGAAAVSVVIILAASIYWAKFLRVPEDGYFERVAPGSSLSDVGSTQSTPTESSAPPPAAPALTDSAAADTLAAAAGDSVPVTATEAVDEPATAAAAEETPAAAPPPPAATTVTDTVAADTGPVFSMDPYTVPVGTGGWAIHVYSLPDSVAADKEIARLKRRGFETGLRIVEVPDKGRWYRLYLGSFSSRAAAREAMPLLLDKLGETWAQVRPYTPDTR